MKKAYVLNEIEKEIIREDARKVFDIKDYKGDGIIIDSESVIEKVEKALTDILYNDGKKTSILQDGNGKIDDSVLCQAIFPVIFCPCHCIGCYAVNACTKKFNGIGKQTAEAWYKWYFIALYFRDAYFMQLNRELDKTSLEECRIHVSGDFIDNEDVLRWIYTIVMHPSIRFYTYTKRDAKRDNMPALYFLHTLANVNIVDSLPCGMKNYGNEDYLKRLEKIVFEKTGEKLYVCKCGTKIEKDFNKEHKKANGGDGKKYCGGRCKLCRDKKYIAFIEHK